MSRGLTAMTALASDKKTTRPAIENQDDVQASLTVPGRDIEMVMSDNRM